MLNEKTREVIIINNHLVLVAIFVFFFVFTVLGFCDVVIFCFYIKITLISMYNFDKGTVYCFFMFSPVSLRDNCILLKVELKMLTLMTLNVSFF